MQKYINMHIGMHIYVSTDQEIDQGQRGWCLILGVSRDYTLLCKKY